MRDVPRAESYVFDASPLIALAKAGLLDPLSRLPNVFLLPAAVGTEVLAEGRRRGAPEVLALERLVSRGRLQVKPVRGRTILRRLQEDPRLSTADREAIALAAEREARLIADDAAVRSVARILAVPLGGSVFLLGRLVEERVMTGRLAREGLDRLVASGWYCSPALYRRAAALFE